MKKANFVYGLLLLPNDNKKLLLSLGHDGQWTLPGGAVGEGENEQDALARLVREQVGYVVKVIEQLGPLHPIGDAGETTRAFDCKAIGGQAAPTATMQDHRFVYKEQMTGLTIKGKPIDRMIWDGFSIMENPEHGPNQVEDDFLPIEGIFCDPDMPHILVEEVEGSRREWPRLDPTSPTGKMEPNQ